MSATESRIFSDPVHGFVTIEGGLLLSLIQTPELQRLRRIRQLGVGYLVFPGAEHSRFGHALGAMALMNDALRSLARQGVGISREEYEAAQAAALLHDIGHGPFSHTLENDLIRDFEHEDMSRVLLVEINRRLGGRLDLALEIFDDLYPASYFHQLVSSQLDMDRLDYLRRDSYYTGVMEGVVGVDRIIKMMRYTGGKHSGALAFDLKSTYTIENFLQARRFMYWQVYLHRGVIAGDYVLKAILRRARHLNREDRLDVRGSSALTYFLDKQIDASQVGNETVWKTYCDLDDSDILYSIKEWRDSSDKILADLSDRFINRRLLKVRFVREQPTSEMVQEWRERVARWLVTANLSPASGCKADIDYYFHTGTVSHRAYDSVRGSINLLSGSGTVQELSEVDNTVTVSALTAVESRHYVTYPGEMDIDLNRL